MSDKAARRVTLIGNARIQMEKYHGYAEMIYDNPNGGHALVKWETWERVVKTMKRVDDELDQPTYLRLLVNEALEEIGHD